MSKRSIFLGAALILLSSVGLAQADDLAKKGAKVFKKCKACHAVGPDAKNKVGPQLNNLMGRKIGGAEGYKYSDALTAKGAEGVVWNEETLTAFLKKPKEFAPGTKMMFSGLKKEKHQKAILAYFKSLSETK